MVSYPDNVRTDSLTFRVLNVHFGGLNGPIFLTVSKWQLPRFGLRNVRTNNHCLFFLFTKKYVCSRQLQDSEDELDQLGQQREKGPGFITESHGARKHRERGGRRKKKKLKLLLLTFLFPLGFIFRFFFSIRFNQLRISYVCSPFPFFKQNKIYVLFPIASFYEPPLQRKIDCCFFSSSSSFQWRIRG